MTSINGSVQFITKIVKNDPRKTNKKKEKAKGDQKSHEETKISQNM